MNNTNRKKGNNYVVDEESGIARIELHRRNEENLWTIIDLEDLEKVINHSYTWFAIYDDGISSNYNGSSYRNLHDRAARKREVNGGNE